MAENKKMMHTSTEPSGDSPAHDSDAHGEFSALMLDPADLEIERPDDDERFRRLAVEFDLLSDDGAPDDLIF